jgi:hypothetical protein
MRPEHLSCVNTAEGIRRINEIQSLYDQDPQAYEQNEMQRKEDYEREMQEMSEQERAAYQQYLLELHTTEELAEIHSKNAMEDNGLPFF